MSKLLRNRTKIRKVQCLQSHHRERTQTKVELLLTRKLWLMRVLSHPMNRSVMGR